MRNVLSNIDQVFHYWANKVQSSGRAGNVYFENEKVYSYGAHFCIARHLPGGTVAFTMRTYSNSTARQVSKARSAARHLSIVYCNDPADSAGRNMRHAQESIVSALNDADKPRIRQTTRDDHKARALRIAENANAYLAALPESERSGCTPLDTGALEYIRDVMRQHEEARRRLREDAAIARNREAADRLNAWRVDPTIHTQGFHGLPVALRLHRSSGAYETGGLLPDAGSVGREVIQTSWGAEIPTQAARDIWPFIRRAMRENVEYRPSAKGARMGVYSLNLIRPDGSIVVGCHDIAYAEIEAMAQAMGLVETATV